jgi:hypothetical protein
MGDRRKLVNFGDPMCVAMLVGRGRERVRPKEVSRSPAAFEEGLRELVRAGVAKFERYTWYK